MVHTVGMYPYVRTHRGTREENNEKLTQQQQQRSRSSELFRGVDELFRPTCRLVNQQFTHGISAWSHLSNVVEGKTNTNINNANSARFGNSSRN